MCTAVRIVADWEEADKTMARSLSLPFLGDLVSAYTQFLLFLLFLLFGEDNNYTFPPSSFSL